MAVSPCLIDLHSVSLMAPVIAIIHLTVKGKKGQEKGNHTHHLSLAPLCPANKPPHCEQSQHMDHRPSPLGACVCLHVCAHACMIYRENMCGCASLVVCGCPLYCMISHWSVRGERWTCLILQLIKSTRELFPRGCANGPHINMSLFSRQEKQEESETDRGGGEGRNTQAEHRWKDA